MDNREYESFNDIINGVKLTILEHGYLNAAIDWQFYNLTSPFNRMYFVISGSGKIYNDQNHEPLNGGQIYLIPLGQEFNYVCDDTLVMFYIHFRIELLAGHDLFDGYKYCVTKPMSTLTIHKLVESAKRSYLSDLIECKGLFYSYIGKFIEPFAENLIDQMKLKGQYVKVYEYVKTHCYADLRINNMAAYLGVNASTLSKGFKGDTGMTLKHYIDRKLIERTQEELLISKDTIKDLAYRLHFSDEFHFSRYFKKHVGMSPSVYRQRNNTYK